MLQFVLCDDNLPVLNRFSTMLTNIFTKHDYQAKIVFQSNNASQILDYIKANHTDVLLLDINLKSNISGIDLAKQVRKYNKNLYLIFTTGHLEYAMLAYKLKTFDYLAKPITQDRLEETVIRLFDDIANSPKNYISLNNKTLIDQDEVQYIKRDGMKLVFYTPTKEYKIYSSFNKIMETLPNNFVRCHKSYIANVNNIINVESKTNTISFGEETQCFIGPKYKNEFLEVFNDGNYAKRLGSVNNA